MNMKHTSFLLLALMACLLAATSCNQNSYSAQIKQEKKLIDAYVKQHNIKIVHEAPDYMNWPEDVYLQLMEYCYFNLSQPGDTATEPLDTYDEVLIRYRRYGLTEPTDTLSFWNTNEMATPISYKYRTQSSDVCQGWIYALPQLKYTGAEGKLICPSRYGFNTENTNVVPYGYDLKIQIKRF